MLGAIDGDVIGSVYEARPIKTTQFRRDHARGRRIEMTRPTRSADPVDDDRQPTRAEIDSMKGPVLLEFGASWCGHCQALAPKLAELLEGHPVVQHIRIEDGPGKPLGRSFGVKLWPTLVFLKDGTVVQQVARPGLGEVREGLELIDGA